VTASGGAGLLDGAVAAVTGAGTGIGREISLRLAAEGADVVLTGRSTQAMEEVAELVRGTGRRALPVAMDLRDPDSITAAAKAADAEFGRVDVLVNNSGVGGPSTPLVEMPLDEWEDTFRVNVTGTMLACQAFLPGMIARRSGSVVVIGSVTGKRPLVNRTPYAASKTALIGLVRTLAWEVGAAGVRVNLVSPGGVEGPRIDWVLEQQAASRGITVEQARAEFAGGSALQRLVRARDVAEAVAFLASPRAAAVTGEDLNVSNGLVMY
jgi:NAD(P)-dependent dehydrogenase (short-subunit alcohol dehydrogenase family)